MFYLRSNWALRSRISQGYKYWPWVRKDVCEVGTIRQNEVMKMITKITARDRRVRPGCSVIENTRKSNWLLLRSSVMGIIMDSGSAKHVASRMEYLSCRERVLPITVDPANVSKISATHRGTVLVEFANRIRRVVKAYLITQLNLNLLSCSSLDDFSISITFEKMKCMLSDRRSDNRVFGTLSKKDSNGLFTTMIMGVKSSRKVNLTGNTVPDEEKRSHETKCADILWNKSMARTIFSAIKKMIRSLKHGMNTEDMFHRKQFTTCVQAKMSRKISKGKLIKGSEDVTIHADIWVHSELHRTEEVGILWRWRQHINGKLEFTCWKLVPKYPNAVWIISRRSRNARHTEWKYLIQITPLNLWHFVRG